MEDLSNTTIKPSDLSKFLARAEDAFGEPKELAKPKKRRGIPSKGSYARRICFVQTPQGEREYHFTKGWR